MAFARAGMKVMGGKGQAFSGGKVIYYVSDTDTLATILADGYFNSISNDLDANYVALVRGTDGIQLVTLTRDSTGLILTSKTTVGPVASGSALTLTEAAHNGRTIFLDTASGSAVTLPAATGTGMKFRFVVSVTVTSNSHTVACAGTDEFAGTVLQTDTDTADALASYPALPADNFDVVTMNGSTTGGLIGDIIEVEDIGTGVWAISGHINGTGTVATPLSAT